MKRILASLLLLLPLRILAADAGLVQVAEVSFAGASNFDVPLDPATDIQAGNTILIYVAYDELNSGNTINWLDGDGLTLPFTITQIGTTFSSGYNSQRYMAFYGRPTSNYSGIVKGFYSSEQAWSCAVLMERSDIHPSVPYTSGERAQQDQTVSGVGQLMTSGNTPTLAHTSGVLIGFAKASDGNYTPGVQAGFENAGSFCDFGGATDTLRVETKHLSANTAVAAEFLSTDAGSNRAAPLAVVLRKITTQTQAPRTANRNRQMRN